MAHDGYLVSEYRLPYVRDHGIAGLDEIDLANTRGLAYMKRLVMAVIRKKSIP